MIDLQIKNKYGNWVSLDLLEFDVPINLQVNQIAELKDRQAGYSQSIKLPKTQNNMEALSLPDRVDMVGGRQYKIIECIMYSGSFEIVGIGGNLVINSVTDNVECQILFGNADLFTKLQNTLFSETDLGQYKHGYKFFEYPINTNYFMPACSFVKEGKDYGLKKAYSESYPFIYFKNAVEKVLDHHGFTIETDVDDANWETLGLNCNKGFDTLQSLEKLEKDVECYYFTDVNIPTYQTAEITFANPNSTYPFLESYDINGNTYTFITDGVLNLTASFTLMDNKGVWAYKYNVYKNGIVIQSENDYVTNGKTLTTSIDAVKGDNIVVKLELAVTLVIDDTAITLRGDTSLSLENKIPQYYSDVELSSLIEIDTQLDLIKLFVNLFALTVDVDNVNKVFRAYSMNKLYENISSAKDWSNKLDFGKEQQIEFKFSDYAQSNYIKLQDNEDDQVKKSFEFNIANENLAKRKDMFEMPLCATKTISTNNETESNTTCSIPMVSKDDDGVLSFAGGKIHLVRAFGDTFYNGGNDYPILSIFDNFASNLFSIGYDYPLFSNVLNEVKYITAYFNLTDKDIKEYDPFTPVYISYFGHYFYINKIVNYTPNKLTKVELLRL